MGKNMVANQTLIGSHRDLGGVFQAGHRGIVRRFARRVLSCQDEVTECRRHILHCVDQQHLKLNTAKYGHTFYDNHTQACFCYYHNHVCEANMIFRSHHRLF